MVLLQALTIAKMDSNDPNPSFYRDQVVGHHDPMEVGSFEEAVRGGDWEPSEVGGGRGGGQQGAGRQAQAS